MAEHELVGAARETWDALAPAWAEHRDHVFATTRPVSEWLVEQLAPEPGQTVLELGAGPGDTGFLAAERLGPTGRLISTDLAPAMVEVARRGAEARGLGNVEHHVVDASAIDLPDQSVDGVLARFAFMLTPEPERVLGEVRRVLRPSGRLAYAVWGPAERNPWMTLPVLALLSQGHPPPGDPNAPGSPFSLGEVARNRALAEGAGFTDVVVEEIEGRMSFGDFDEYWSVQGSVSGPIARLLSSLSDGQAADVRGALEPLVAEHRTDAGLAFPSLAIGVRAR